MTTSIGDLARLDVWCLGCTRRLPARVSSRTLVPFVLCKDGLVYTAPAGTVFYYCSIACAESSGPPARGNA